MSKSILVIDDEPVVVEISKRKLEETGFEVQVAHNGNEAFSALKKKKADLIFLDVQMPDMNGYTFIMEKDRIPEYVNIPIVVLTAYNETEPLFKRHGIKAYLLKPLKLQDLVNKAVEILGRP
ncbi:MAG: response regulator [Candidatus Omnitrophica bacterium]|nr:response regulator [Candidatus Omnitrophota bacterium]MDE2010375.1 response regulator [Candidatus Omnitrophota bacterium]MDE2214869.1 response regulator [Candidatus Omnitrophota bacterium]MDE2230800.1 response regulator [Candidatus Omnitrophota bacterium]